MRKLWLRSLGQILIGYDWHPYEKGNLDTETNTHTGETSYDDEGRDQDEVSTTKGCQRLPPSWEERVANFSSKYSEGIDPFDLGLPASQTVRQWLFVILRHPVYDSSGKLIQWFGQHLAQKHPCPCRELRQPLLSDSHRQSHSQVHHRAQHSPWHVVTIHLERSEFQNNFHYC